MNGIGIPQHFVFIISNYSAVIAIRYDISHPCPHRRTSMMRFEGYHPPDPNIRVRVRGDSQHRVARDDTPRNRSWFQI